MTDPLSIPFVISALGASVCAGAWLVGLRHHGRPRPDHHVDPALVAFGLFLAALVGLSGFVPGSGNSSLGFRLGSIAGLLGVQYLSREWHRTVTQRSLPAWHAVLAVAVLVGWLTIPSIHAGSSAPPGWWWPFMALAVSPSILAPAVTARALLGRPQRTDPAPLRRRVQLLGAGFAALGLASAAGGLFFTLPVGLSRNVVGATMAAALSFTVGAFVPPAGVRRWLRADVERVAQTALRRVVAAQRADEALDIFLPVVRDLAAARAVAVKDARGRVVGSVGFDPDALREIEEPLTFALQNGELVIWPDRLGPALGATETDLCRRLALDLSLALLAVDRFEALEREARVRLSLEAARRRLDQANMALREYGRTVAHDLKAPLAIIRGVAETVATIEDVSPMGRDLLERAKTNVDRAVELVDSQLSAASNAHTGNGGAAVPLTHVARWVESQLTDELAASNARVVISPGLGDGTDEHVLRRVLLNLVRNALQHAGTGGPLTVTIGPGSAADEMLVSDDGRGIPPRQWERIFESGVSLQPDTAGSGIGLAGCRTAMRRLGGDLRVANSAMGRGTTFMLRLPAPRGVRAAAP